MRKSKDERRPFNIIRQALNTIRQTLNAETLTERHAEK
jgi:hypothetical protein